jgi:hypothetical protein
MKRIISAVFLSISLSLVLSGCGRVNLSDEACAAYKSNELSRIIPSFAALVREDPQYKPYLDASEKYVTFEEDQIRNESQKGSLLDYKVTYFRIPWEQYQAAKINLDTFCAR